MIAQSASCGVWLCFFFKIILYLQVQKYLQNIITGIAECLSEAKTWLKELGFKENLQLGVFTEDDDDIEQSYERVK